MNGPDCVQNPLVLGVRIVVPVELTKVEFDKTKFCAALFTVELNEVVGIVVSKPLVAFMVDIIAEDIERLGETVGILTAAEFKAKAGANTEEK